MGKKNFFWFPTTVRGFVLSKLLMSENCIVVFNHTDLNEVLFFRFLSVNTDCCSANI